MNSHPIVPPARREAISAPTVVYPNMMTIATEEKSGSRWMLPFTIASGNAIANNVPAPATRTHGARVRVIARPRLPPALPPARRR